MSDGWLQPGPGESYRYRLATDAGAVESEGLYSLRGDTLVLLQEGASPGVAVSTYRRYLMGRKEGRTTLTVLGRRESLEDHRPWLIAGDTTETIRCRDVP